MRGPLDVLREEWTEDETSKTPIAAHVEQMRDRLEEMMEIVKKNMTRAQGNQKRIYDKSTRERELKVGDQVLALLPNEENKLKLEWVGPYKVLRALSPVIVR